MSSHEWRSLMSTPHETHRARYLWVALALALALTAAVLFFPARADAQSPIDEVRPAPPSIGADVPLTYFAPAPSTDNPGLIGPLQLLRSGPIDLDEGTITLPLYEGVLRRGSDDARRTKGGRAQRRAGLQPARAGVERREHGRQRADRGRKRVGGEAQPVLRRQRRPLAGARQRGGDLPA